ncbi:MAG: coenzyme F420-0:L-glutamate ligase, partial [Acidobacteriota bacterium]
MIPVPGIAEIHPGDNLAQAILAALTAAGISLTADDIIIVAQKVVSKAEGRLVDLATITPSEQAVHIAQLQGRDPRVIEAILSDSSTLRRIDPLVLITETLLGCI